MTLLIVLPGLDGTATLHSDFLNFVSESFESVSVIPYPPDLALGYGELEALVRAKLPQSTRFILLGESFSGPIALSIAANPPANLAGVVLSTTFARSPLPAISPFAPLARLAPIRAVPISLLSWWLLGRWTTPELRTSLEQALLAVSPAVLKFRAMATLRVRTPDLAKITAPLLYLRATGDRLLPASAAEHLRSSIPNCVVADITGPHLLLQAAPKECASAVGSFAKSLA